jgi:hypothetical protein
LTSKERWSWEDQEHGLVCSPYNAPIDSSTRRSLKSERDTTIALPKRNTTKRVSRSLKSEKEQNSPTSEEKRNQRKDI